MSMDFFRTDDKAATALSCHRNTVANLKERLVNNEGLDRRIPDCETLEQETTAWYTHPNHLQKSVDWQFTTADAHIRLKRLYPQI
jgi:hypothetical protein